MTTRLHHLNCGTFCPMGKLLMNGHGSPLERGKLVCHCLLIEGGNGLTLVDTGLGTRDIHSPMSGLPGPIWQAINAAQLDPAETAVQQLRAKGFDPNDVRDIVLTHPDFDHAGGMADFPNARVHVFRPEFDECMTGRRWISRERYRQAQFAHDPKWEIHELAGERWLGFPMVRALGEDVLLVPLEGHSRGHCGVAVETSEGWFLHCGDAIFDVRELRTEGRFVPAGVRAYENVFQHDRRRRLENMERLRELARTAAGDVRLICSHDAQDFERLAQGVPARSAYLA